METVASSSARVLMWQGSHVLVWQPAELTEIYRAGVNLCVWRRGLGSELSQWLGKVCPRHMLHIVERVDAERADLRGRGRATGLSRTQRGLVRRPARWQLSSRWPVASSFHSPDAAR